MQITENLINIKTFIVITWSLLVADVGLAQKGNGVTKDPESYLPWFYWPSSKENIFPKQNSKH